MTHHNNHDHNHEASEHPEIIRLDHITVEFDHKVVLDDVDLSVREGDFLAISGPNGGGKTTLLRVLLQLLKPTRGRVTYLHKKM